MEKEKKKKIYLILKKIGIGILIFIVLVILINSCTKKTNALEYEYQDNSFVYDYTFVGTVDSITNMGNGLYRIDINLLLATFNVFEYSTTDTWQRTNTFYPFTQSLSFIWDQPNIEVEKITPIDITNLNSIITESDIAEDNASDAFYFINVGANTFQGLFSGEVFLNQICTYNDYVNWQNYIEYNKGYEGGTDTTDPMSPYNQGYSKGQKDQELADEERIKMNSASYQAQINQLEESIQELMSQDNNSSWLTFRHLLGLIFMYPIRFLKEGFDVNIWGVNLGGLMIGLLMIGITVTVVGVFLGRRRI